MSNITHADTLSAYTDNPATGISKTDWNTAHTVAFVGAKAYMAATQAIPTGTETAVTFDTEEFDTDGFHDNSSNTSRFTVPSGKAGKYRLLAGGLVNETGGTELLFRKNGSTYLRGGSGGSTNANLCTISGLEDLAVGDYVEMIIFHTTGSDKTIGHATIRQSQMTMSVELLGT